jgi:hypothetical protein
MPDYRRADVKGGMFFFTVVLADRSSNLLIEEIDRLRTAYRTVQERHPFKQSWSASCPTTSMSYGRCRRMIRIFPRDGISSRAGFCAASRTGQDQGLARFPAHRSAPLTIFWHCDPTAFSSRTASRRVVRQRTFNGFDRGFGRLQGSGNADSQRKVRSSGWSGFRRPCASGCVRAHPSYWASASYRPLRAVWAVCAWALRGCARTPKPFSAHDIARPTQKESMP